MYDILSYIDTSELDIGAYTLQNSIAYKLLFNTYQNGKRWMSAIATVFSSALEKKMQVKLRKCNEAGFERKCNKLLVDQLQNGSRDFVRFRPWPVTTIQEVICNDCGLFSRLVFFWLVSSGSYQSIHI